MLSAWESAFAAWGWLLGALSPPRSEIDSESCPSESDVCEFTCAEYIEAISAAVPVTKGALNDVPHPAA